MFLLALHEECRSQMAFEMIFLGSHPVLYVLSSEMIFLGDQWRIQVFKRGRLIERRGQTVSYSDHARSQGRAGGYRTRFWKGRLLPTPPTKSATVGGHPVIHPPLDGKNKKLRLTIELRHHQVKLHKIYYKLCAFPRIWSTFINMQWWWMISNWVSSNNVTYVIFPSSLGYINII